MTISLPLKTLTDQDLARTDVPWPDSAEDLVLYAKALLEREHDYNTQIHAMSMIATAAFRFAARRLGVSGFQASCADMDFIRRTRSINGPFLFIVGEQALFPQYDVKGQVDDFITQIAPWLASQARQRIADDDTNTLANPEAAAAPAVRAHWEGLAAAADGVDPETRH